MVRRWWWVGLLAAVVVAFAVGLATRPTSAAATGPRQGYPAPAWSGTALNGTQLTSSAERGHWVVLNFFATWCGPCKVETPQLVRFAATNQTSKVQVIGVVHSDSDAAVRAFVASHGVTWPLLPDADDDISAAYRVTALPQSFVIRPDGVLAARVFGGVTAAGLDKLVG
jgi:cytochrome c biogenesis protein CcmG/thiol:disulfide interchange protein DsbE